eukprot:GEZU01025321.1.p1 GENE.GEZU01025321.1~~GEZU01025321.1.p1  ORF type:complete len:1017 (+),score=125.80 GEZU01025321.1:110-3160(+)
MVSYSHVCPIIALVVIALILAAGAASGRRVDSGFNADATTFSTTTVKIDSDSTLRFDDYIRAYWANMTITATGNNGGRLDSRITPSHMDAVAFDEHGHPMKIEHWCHTQERQRYSSRTQPTTSSTQSHEDSRQHFDSRLQSDVGLQYNIPPCGYTICDDPVLMQGYADAVSNNMLDTVTLKYSVWTLANADGTNPMSVESDTATQVNILNEHFAAAGIQWEGTWNSINADNLANGVVFPYTDCDPADIGKHLEDCAYPETGWDAGSFICPNYGTCSTSCNSYAKIESGECSCICIRYSSLCNQKAGNGVCDTQCNWKKFNWDGGDCCTSPSTGNCRDPNSPNRNWIGDFNLKRMVNASSSQLNLFVVKMNTNRLLGYATFPWDDRALQPTGGVVFNTYPRAWGIDSSMGLFGITGVHEIGHILGLWHTHYGVTDLSYRASTKSSACGISCFEHQPTSSTSLSTTAVGDLCADTRPTPVNYQCRDPSPCTSGSALSCSDCSNQPWVNTPYTNFMGYGPDTCLNNFTPQQMGRMRCYIDLKYSSWTGVRVPSVIVLKPVVTQSRKYLIVSWFAPLSKGKGIDFKYIISRTPAFSSGKSHVQIDVPATAVNDDAFQYIDKDVKAGVTYTYAVKAANSAGNATHFSPTSSPFTVQSSVVAPSAPSALQVSVSSAEATFSLSWTAPLFDGDGTITEYQVTYWSASSPANVTVVCTVNASTSFSLPFDRMARGLWYNFTVAAVNEAGPGQQSEVVSVRVPYAAPSVPRSLTATGEASSTSIVLSWHAPTDTGGSPIVQYHINYKLVEEDTDSAAAAELPSSNSTMIVVNASSLLAEEATPTTDNNGYNYTIASLSPASTYSVAVAAESEEGGLGPFTDYVSARTSSIIVNPSREGTREGDNDGDSIFGFSKRTVMVLAGSSIAAMAFVAAAVIITAGIVLLVIKKRRHNSRANKGTSDEGAMTGKYNQLLEERQHQMQQLGGGKEELEVALPEVELLPQQQQQQQPIVDLENHHQQEQATEH